MRIAIGSDHRGYQLKSKIVAMLEEGGHEVDDVGTMGSDSVDYPDYASIVGKQVSQQEVDRGILICGTGIGMAIAANKIAGVRAASCSDELTAEMSRRHNSVNVLCLSADMLGDRLVGRLVDVWLKTEFEGGRHARRVEKIGELEQTADGCESPAGS